MASRCPHGILAGSKLCVIPSCSEYDGQGSIERQPQKAKFAKRPPKQVEPQLCGHCGESKRLKRSDYCAPCLARFRAPRQCVECGKTIVLRDNGKLAEHVKKQRCGACNLAIASKENSIYVRGLGVPRV